MITGYPDQVPGWKTAPGCALLWELQKGATQILWYIDPPAAEGGKAERSVASFISLRHPWRRDNFALLIIDSTSLQSI